MVYTTKIKPPQLKEQAHTKARKQVKEAINEAIAMKTGSRSNSKKTTQRSPIKHQYHISREKEVIHTKFIKQPKLPVQKIPVAASLFQQFQPPN